MSDDHLSVAANGLPRVSVLGAGSWGTALARLISANGAPVTLWECVPETAAGLQSARENLTFLPGYQFPASLSVTASLQAAVDTADLLVLAVPSSAVREVCSSLCGVLKHAKPLLSASKGLEAETGRRLSEVIAATVPLFHGSLAALSGPNLAVELAAGVPTATVVASPDHAVAESFREVLACPSLRVYTNEDIAGVELGGALKNVLAIGSGICEGMGYGDNTKAALLTRGLAEMVRVGVAVGARAETFAGLSGVGDLFATASSRLSRNLRVGLALGQGRSLEEALEEVKQVAEGVPTTRAAVHLAERAGVEMPIAREIHAILFEGRPPREGLANLMSRRWKDEVG